MTLARIATAAGIAVLVLFVVVVVAAGHSLDAGVVLLVVVAIAGLIAAGNLLYGRRSHYAAVVDRNRPAQEAHDRAAAVAADARRASAEAARRGERSCPLDPAQAESRREQ